MAELDSTHVKGKISQVRPAHYHIKVSDIGALGSGRMLWSVQVVMYIRLVTYWPTKAMIATQQSEQTASSSAAPSCLHDAAQRRPAEQSSRLSMSAVQLAFMEEDVILANRFVLGNQVHLAFRRRHVFLMDTGLAWPLMYALPLRLLQLRSRERPNDDFNK